MSHWSAEWSRYLAAFHTERPGVTEEVLNRALSGQHSPYKWLARAVAGRAELVLDIGCGSGAMTRELARDGRVVIGVDLSDSELQRARNSTTGSWVQADARQLPFADGSVDAVVSTLGLAVIHPLKNWLDEVHRVLKPGGVLAALTPTVRPVSASDIKVALNIGRELRQVPNFPVGIELASGPVLLESGLRKIEDNRERYRYLVRTREDAELLMSALYLPGIEHQRVTAAVDWLMKGVARHGQVAVPIPMRRIVAMRQSSAHS